MHCSSLTLFSPAKINLFFRVLGKRKDGYHEVASLMQTLSFGDRVTLQKSSSDRLTCSDQTLACDQSNLAMRAIHLFREQTGHCFPVEMFIEKNIPVQAGLGGGSSNVATVLWGLNTLAGRPAQPSQLQQWSAKISSDAPFFFSQGTAYATGRNEIVQNIKPLCQKQVVIAKPHWGLSTHQVYRHCKLSQCSPLSPTSLLSSFTADQLTAVNDLEPAAQLVEPKLKAIKQKLLDLGFSFVSMTGSGSAFYCLGNVQKPTLPNVSFFSCSFLWRQAEQWYALTC